jgi:hypothetical protein
VVSHAAIAAVLARADLSAGERLVAFSLASFADPEQLTFAGTPAAAARAGLGKSRYLQARDRLVGRGLIDVEGRAGGRGRSRTVKLVFARSGPWWDGDVNAQLLEAVLGVQPCARPLVAALTSTDTAGAASDAMLAADSRPVDESADQPQREHAAAGKGPFLTGVSGSNGPVLVVGPQQTRLPANTAIRGSRGRFRVLLPSGRRLVSAAGLVLAP